VSVLVTNVVALSLSASTSSSLMPAGNGGSVYAGSAGLGAERGGEPEVAELADGSRIGVPEEGGVVRPVIG
jgi:hypothetical protein